MSNKRDIPTCDLSVIVPVHNEENSIPELVERLLPTVKSLVQNYEIIFVNDGSSDNSLTSIKELCAKNLSLRYIDFSRNFGHQIAVSAGLDKCMGQAVVIIDADLQDPPELISELYQNFKHGFDVVYAQRRSREGDSFYKKISAKYFYRFLRYITNTPIPVDTGDYRLISRPVVNALKSMPEKNKFLRGQIAWLGFKQTAVLFDRAERKHGETGYTFKKMLHLAMDGITGFSNTPLKIVSRMGFVISLVSLAIIIYALFSHFILDKTIQGWTSLIISTMFIGGVQLISIGVIGEYIARITDNVRDRPLYVIKESNID